MRKNMFIGLIAALAIVAVTTLFLRIRNPSEAEPIPQAPVPGMVTLVDLGAEECIPCKMMAPILDELEKEYQGRAAVIFIDVWKNPEAGQKFGIRTIPTQIFYDAQGQEITRHEGFLDKKSIMYIFLKLGVK